MKSLNHIRSVSVHPNFALRDGGGDFGGDSAKVEATFDVIRNLRERGERALVLDRWLTSDPVLATPLVRRVELTPRVALRAKEHRLDSNHAFPKGGDLLPDADLLCTHRGKFGVHLLT